MSVRIAPSILAADFASLGKEVRAADAAGGDWIHVDIMDGHFVPNLTFGPQILTALRPCTKKPIDVHLMISHPARYLPLFCESGADCLSWHIECGDKPADVMKALAKFSKVKKGVALKPETPIAAIRPLLEKLDFVLVMTVEPGFGSQKFMVPMLSKVASLKILREELGLKFMIEIDGGVDEKNAALAIAAGVDVLVAGTAVYGKANYKRAISALRGHHV